MALSNSEREAKIQKLAELEGFDSVRGDVRRCRE